MCNHPDHTALIIELLAALELPEDHPARRAAVKEARAIADAAFALTTAEVTGQAPGVRLRPLEFTTGGEQLPDVAIVELRGLSVKS